MIHDDVIHVVVIFISFKATRKVEKSSRGIFDGKRSNDVVDLEVTRFQVLAHSCK